MKRRALITLLTATILAAPAYAKTVYVDDLQEVMLRLGPSTTDQVIARVPSGRRLDLLEERSGWALVSFPDSGKKGWMVARFLTEEEPAASALPRVSAENDELKKKVEELSNQNEEFLQNLEGHKKTAEEMSGKYDALARESASFLAVKKELAAVRGELSQARDSEAEARGALADIDRNRGISWFLAGAGAILAGFFLGWIVRPRKKRSSLL